VLRQPCTTIEDYVEAYIATLPKETPGWRNREGANVVLQSQIKGAQRRREAWKQAKPFWGGLSLADIDAETSQDYQAWRGKALNTMRHELGVVRSSLAYAHSKKLIEAVPPVILPAIPPSSVDHLSKADFKRFLTGCSMPHVTLFAILGVTTGARTTAILQAKWDQVDWQRCQLNLNPVGADMDGLKPRVTVALNGRAMDALREAKAGATSDYIIEYHGGAVINVRKGIEAAVVRTKIPCHPHMFRHSAAVWMAEDRVPMEEIAAFLGHKNVAITIRIYARFNPDYLQRAARSLDW
jgi:integrase